MLDHPNGDDLIMPNAEQADGILVVARHGYSFVVHLSSVGDGAGLPATGDGAMLAQKAAFVITGERRTFVSDVSQTVNGWDLTYVSGESLG